MQIHPKVRGLILGAVAGLLVAWSYPYWAQFPWRFGATAVLVVEFVLSIVAGLVAASMASAPRAPVLVQAVAIVLARRLYTGYAPYPYGWFERFYWLPRFVVHLIPIAIGTIPGAIAAAMTKGSEPTPTMMPYPSAAQLGAPQGLLPIRSIAEEHLYMALHPCPCGEVAFEEKHGIVSVGNDLASRFEGPCKKCGAARRFDFRALEVGQQVPWPAYGGAEPSKIIDAGQWLATADRYAKAVPAAKPSSPEERQRALRLMQQALAAEEEVLKFIPPGADEVPPTAFWTPDGKAVRDREPGRFRKLRLEAVVGVYRESVKGLGG